MERAEVLIGPRRREGKGIVLIRVHDLRPESLVGGGDGVRDIVAICPGHRCTGSNGDLGRGEAEIVDAHRGGRGRGVSGRLFLAS